MSTVKLPSDPHAKRDFVIGSAILPKPQRMTREAEAIQTALLGVQPIHRKDRIVLGGCAVALAALAAVLVISHFAPAI